MSENENNSITIQSGVDGSISKPEEKKVAPVVEESKEEVKVEKKDVLSEEKKDKIVQIKKEKKLGDLFVGRRKASIARVKFVKGSGKITINKKPLEEYFGRKLLQFKVKQPLVLVERLNEFDISANVNGGGITGQAEAIQLGIARCLQTIEPELRKPLKKAGMLTRDSRVVERKKFGLHKARRATQFSKR